MRTVCVASWIADLDEARRQQRASGRLGVLHEYVEVDARAQDRIWIASGDLRTLWRTTDVSQRLTTRLRSLGSE